MINFVLHREHGVLLLERQISEFSTGKRSQFIAKIHSEHINKLRGQDVEFLV